MAGLFETAVAHHHAGRLIDAEQCYRQVLAASPDHADALHLLGLLQARAGQRDAAIDLMTRAAKLVPGRALYHYALGNVLLDAGRLTDAAPCYDAAIRIDPEYFEAHVNLSMVLRDLKRLPDAVAACDRAIALRPDDAVAYFNRGRTYRDLERWNDALRDYDTVIRIRPDFADAHANRGLTLGELGRWEEAIASHQNATALRPEAAEFHYNSGNALRAAEQPERAIASYDHCLARNAGHVGARVNRALAQTDLGRIDAALMDLDIAIAARPDDARIRYNRGVILDRTHRLEPALADYGHALSLQPVFPECAYNMGLILLLLGRFERGWPGYEARFQVPDYPGRRRAFAQPRWTGEALNGRTLLIHAEQGFGDAIQLSRYAATIEGGTVILEVPSGLARLMTGLPGVDRLVTATDELPPFDLYCPMLSLPAVFHTSATTIPPPARLKVPDMITRLPETTGGLRIGIAWSGNPAHTNDRNRSLPLRMMLPLLEHTSRLFVLQTQMSDEDRVTLTATPEIVDLGTDFQDFADTAAVIEQLNLIICVDTSVAHLAATLGKPTWILLCFRPDWRWQLDRDDSPWYPTARLFRQNKPGDWDSVIARVGDALRASDAT